MIECGGGPLRAALHAPAQTQATEPWNWDEATLRDLVSRLRAGPRHTMTLPPDAQVAVALSFDADDETPWLRSLDGMPASALAAAEYDHRVGTPRILELLARFSAPATFFFPGVSALLHPDQVRAVVDAGHEVGVHGWIHESPEVLEPGQERALLARSLDVLESVSGVRPRGMRTPSFGFSPHTLELAVEFGLTYDSSLMADDEPYELLLAGQPTGVVEVPVDWSRDDAAYFVTDRHGGLRPQPSPRQLLEAWRDEYRAARRDKGLFQLTLHPDLIGRRSRLVILEELLSDMLADGDVWFATHAQVADAWWQTRPPVEQEGSHADESQPT